jgi:hypothetical protein
LPYAALLEIHHPDYLAPADLAAIYGPANGADRPELVVSLRELAAQRVR